MNPIEFLTFPPSQYAVSMDADSEIVKPYLAVFEDFLENKKK